jgi:hypothetical protein
VALATTLAAASSTASRRHQHKDFQLDDCPVALSSSELPKASQRCGHIPETIDSVAFALTTEFFDPVAMLARHDHVAAWPPATT